MMTQYETMMLARTEITNDEISMIEKYLDKIFANVDGTLTTFDKWGKYKLAYPVKKNNYGIYILTRYNIPKENAVTILEEIQTFFKIKCNEIVLRSVTVKLDPTKSNTYQKPDPIDASKTENVDSFLKESKIENFLDSVKVPEGKEASTDTSTPTKENGVKKEIPQEASKDEKPKVETKKDETPKESTASSDDSEPSNDKSN